MSDSELNKFPFANAAAEAAAQKLAQEEKLAANLSKQLKASGQMAARLGDPVLHPLPPRSYRLHRKTPIIYSR